MFLNPANMLLVVRAIRHTADGTAPVRFVTPSSAELMRHSGSDHEDAISTVRLKYPTIPWGLCTECSAFAPLEWLKPLRPYFLEYFLDKYTTTLVANGRASGVNLCDRVYLSFSDSCCMYTRASIWRSTIFCTSSGNRSMAVMARRIRALLFESTIPSR